MEIVTFIKDLINQTKENYTINKEDINDVKNYIVNLTKSIYEKDRNFTLYILDQMLEDDLEIIDSDVVLPRGNEIISVPEDRIADVNHLKFIRELPQPEQRTTEWFDQRRKMLTASTCAQALDENPYKNQSSEHLVLDKVGLGSKFPDNIFVHHGKKYEPIATMIYEHLYDVQVEEFGLVPDISCDPKDRFLGASPDGICTQYKLTDRTFSKKLNTMLEIKCPYSRKIKLKGKIDGEICPHYYWCQCQQQLHCCKLDKCDFWQVSLDEFYSEEELLNDPNEPKIYEEQEKPMSFNPNIVQGVIIQLKPINDTTYMPYNCTYIYPPHLNFTLSQYRRWAMKELSDLSAKEEFKTFKFDKLLYWKAKTSHNVCIKYDEKWFSESLSKLRKVWDKVLYYRKNMKEANELKDKLYPKKVFDDAFISSESSEEEIKVKKKKKQKGKVKVKKKLVD